MNEVRDVPDFDAYGDRLFDAYGDRLTGLRPRAASALERRVRAAGIAVFWGLALLIVAGRVHYGPVVGGEGGATIELAAR